MPDLQSALFDIAEIRRQMTRAVVFRGFRAATTLFSACAAVGGAAAQAAWVPQPAGSIDTYLYLWLCVVVVSLSVIGAGVLYRYQRSDSPLQRDLTATTIGQFMPTLVTGAMLTVVIAEFNIQVSWMLSGLWLMLTGLGVFASRRSLPRGTSVVAAWYILAGLYTLACGRGVGWSPWAMGIGFGVGQSAAAAVLYFGLERRRA